MKSIQQTAYVKKKKEAIGSSRQEEQE